MQTPVLFSKQEEKDQIDSRQQLSMGFSCTLVVLAALVEMQLANYFISMVNVFSMEMHYNTDLCTSQTK